MTDEELIKRLRLLNEVDANVAADRIKALIAERDEDHKNINLKADFIEKTINQLAEAEKVALQLVEALSAVLEIAERNERGSITDSARAILAEIEGETK